SSLLCCWVPVRMVGDSKIGIGFCIARNDCGDCGNLYLFWTHTQPIRLPKTRHRCVWTILIRSRECRENSRLCCWCLRLRAQTSGPACRGVTFTASAEEPCGLLKHKWF